MEKIKSIAVATTISQKKLYLEIVTENQATIKSPHMIVFDSESNNIFTSLCCVSKNDIAVINDILSNVCNYLKTSFNFNIVFTTEVLTYSNSIDFDLFDNIGFKTFCGLNFSDSSDFEIKEWTPVNSTDFLQVLVEKDDIPNGIPIPDALKKDTNNEETKEDFNISKDRIFTAEEKALIEENHERCKDFVCTNDTYDLIRQLVFNIKAMPGKIHGIRLYGDSGTGKTTTAQLIADKLGLPYRAVKCDCDTDEQSLFGTMTGVGEKISFNRTGLTEALLGGGVVELQEFSAITNPSVQTALNSILDKSAVFKDVDGIYKNIHQDCLIIATYNNAGIGKFCESNKVAVSTKNRFFFAHRLNLPPQDELVDMLMSSTKFNDRATVKKIVKLCFGVGEGSIRSLIEHDEIEDAMSVRNAENWILNYMNCPFFNGKADGWVKASILTVVEAVGDNEPEEVQNAILSLIEATMK